MKKPLSRRTVLRGAAGISLALPFLDAMEARGQTTAPARRLIFFYTPDGYYRPTFDITNASSETSFTLSPTLQPLETFKSKLIIPDNLDQLAPMASTDTNDVSKIKGKLIPSRPRK